MNQAAGSESKAAVLPKSGFREIITKAVCGTAKKYLRYSHYIALPEGNTASQVLGTSVTQLRLKEPDVMEVSGSSQMGMRLGGVFEVHVWYAYNSGRNTDIIRQTINFEEVIPMADYDGRNFSLADARAMIIKSPQCQEAVISKDGRIKVDFELGVYAEVIGETKVCVRVYSDGEED